MKIQRTWSLVVGIILVIIAVRAFVAGEVMNDSEMAYNIGSLIGLIGLPLFFLVFAFVGKNK